MTKFQDKLIALPGEEVQTRLQTAVKSITDTPDNHRIPVTTFVAVGLMLYAIWVREDRKVNTYDFVWKKFVEQEWKSKSLKCRGCQETQSYFFPISINYSRGDDWSYTRMIMVCPVCYMTNLLEENSREFGGDSSWNDQVFDKFSLPDVPDVTY